MIDYKPSRRRKMKRNPIQAILLTIAFMLLLGVAGKSDNDSKQAILEEKVNIRDSLKRAQDEYVMNMILQSDTCGGCHK